MDLPYAGDLIDRLLAADPLWSLRPDRQPEHLLLAVRCLGCVSPAEARTLRAPVLADIVIALLEAANVESDSPDQPESLARAIVEEVLPVFTVLGADWAGRARFEDWYLTVGQHMTDRYPRDWRCDPVVVAARLYFALRTRDDQCLERLRRYAVDGHRTQVRQAAIHAIVAGWRDAPGTLSWLRRYVTAAGNEAGLWHALVTEAAGTHPPWCTTWHDLVCTDPGGPGAAGCDRVDRRRWDP